MPIETEITTATTQFIKSRIERANTEQPLALVFFINTPGGQIIAAEDISDAILQDAQVPTISVVANAISAGALIAMSAEEVAMLPGSSIGAATAINGITGETASEKINSVWRNQFRSVAEARGRNGDVAEGMVSTRVEIPGLSTSEELITLSASQAVEFNIADIEARTLNDALAQFGYSGVETQTLEPNFVERLGTSLGNPLIAAALLVIGLGGVLIEIFSPGFGLPGIIGILALSALGASAFIATPAGIFDLLLIVAGILLIAAEVLFIPGTGIAGILGIVAIGVAVVRIFPNDYDWLWVFSYSAIFGGVLFGLLVWMLPNSRVGKILTLSTRLTNEPGADPAKAKLVGSMDYLLNQQGTALTDLRPAGVAKFGDERVDVVTEGDFVSRGTLIEVIRVNGTRVIVRETITTDN